MKKLIIALVIYYGLVSVAFAGLKIEYSVSKKGMRSSVEISKLSFGK